MCATDDMKKLASEFYETADAYRDTEPEIAARMVAEADDILTQFGPLDCPPAETSDVPGVEAKIDSEETKEDEDSDIDNPKMREILRMMSQKNREFVAIPEFPRRRRIIREFFTGL